MCCHIREEILCLCLVEKSVGLAGKHLLSMPPRSVTLGASQNFQVIVMWICVARMCATYRHQVLVNISYHD